ncbi:Glucuronide transport protein YihP, homologous to YihO [[Actinomadura] parvosata subsp. kistnae]|uniref:MFS transporter n=1 Tax=[Actinomadura] parvosata TaxID=1955412 RepID=UPI000D2DA3D0|nr:Glucuronide transport protein YihP, homologous to YihO [Actinomadura parvosata subsp. kistnae]
MLTFLTPAGGDEPWTITYATVTFILVGLAYSIVNVPYGALLSMATRDSGTRMKLAGLRSFGVGIGLILVSTLTQPLITAIGGVPTSRLGFGVTITIFSVAGMLLIWLVHAWVKERVALTPAARERGHLGASLRTLARNRPWLSVFAFSILSFARLGVITGGAVYFALHTMRDPAAISVILLAFSLSAVVGSLLTAPILRVIGHRRGIVLGLVAYIALTLSLVPLREQLVAFTVVFFAANLVGGLGFVAAPALTADTVEWQEWRGGRREEGLLFSGYSMSTKVGAALGSALLAWGLAAIAYDPAAVTPAVAGGIMWLFIALPAGLAVLQILAIAPYDLQRRLPAIKAEISARRHAEDPAARP